MSAGGSNGKPGALDSFLDHARYAMQDIRQKLFEEAWFGRVVTAEHAVELQSVTPNREAESVHDPSTPGRVNFEDVWGRAPAQDYTPERDAPGERDLDR